MATSTELIRAAEHMRHQGALMLEDERWHVGTSYCEAADMLEREAKRLQAIEAQQHKRSWPVGTKVVVRAEPLDSLSGMRGAIWGQREDGVWLVMCADGLRRAFCEDSLVAEGRSWPEGWPPFAVLRRAYSATGMHHYPSTRVCERSRVRSHRAVASLTRARWQRVLSQVLADPSSP